MPSTATQASTRIDLPFRPAAASSAANAAAADITTNDTTTITTPPSSPFPDRYPHATPSRSTTATTSPIPAHIAAHLLTPSPTNTTILTEQNHHLLLIPQLSRARHNLWLQTTKSASKRGLSLSSWSAAIDDDYTTPASGSVRAVRARNRAEGWLPWGDREVVCSVAAARKKEREEAGEDEGEESELEDAEKIIVDEGGKQVEDWDAWDRDFWGWFNALARERRVLRLPGEWFH